ncbi:YciI family protein [Tistrella mobilis]|jgi:uncharacterized protein YciI
MFVVLLKFIDRGKAAGALAGHKAWLDEGFAEGRFLLAGSLASGQGGTVFIHGLSEEDLERRVAADPFVAQGVVTAEIVKITPNRADARLDFLTR